MAFLDKLMHRSSHLDTETCQHLDLVAQFWTPSDARDESKAYGYRCASCGQVFEPGQAFLMRMHRSSAGSPASRN